MTQIYFGFEELIAWRRNAIKDSKHPLRRLFDKHNSYGIAGRLGIPIPKIFHVSNSGFLDFLGDLPSAYVIKTRFGHSGKGVACCVDGVDLMTGRPFDVEQFNAMLVNRPGYLIEEFVPNSDGRYDVVESLKVFYFGRAGLVIRYVRETFNPEKRCITPLEQSFYTESWEHLDIPVSSYVKAGPAIEKPEKLDELISYSRRLGDSVNDFVRIDFFMPPNGPVFNEFSPFPFNGRCFTKYGSELFGSLWTKGFLVDAREAVSANVESMQNYGL